MTVKNKTPFFAASIEDASVLRKFTILFLVSSVIPMVLLYYAYFKNNHIGHAAMALVVIGVLTGFLAIRSLLTRAISISQENLKAIEPFLSPEAAKELSEGKNELVVLSRTFAAVIKQLQANIDELKAKNEDLKAMDQLKDDFLNNVSHELRLPLTVIQESIRQISEGMFGEINETQQKYCNMSLRNIHRLKALIDNMLDLSKIETGKLEILKNPVDMQEIIHEVTFDFSYRIEKKGLNIETELPPHPVRAIGDKDKIIQVLLNLVSNAYKFTEKGVIKIMVVEKGDWVECRVEDTGVGIAPAEIPYLFSKFHQVGRPKVQQEKGTGLGLVISKHIIELHGGKISVESTEGIGSTFSFALPKAPAA